VRAASGLYYRLQPSFNVAGGTSNNLLGTTDDNLPVLWEQPQIAHRDERNVNRSRCGFADVLSDPSAPLTTQQMGHYRVITNWFPDGQEALDKIEGIYRKHNPELCDELYLSLIVACLDRILSDTRPKTVTGAIKRAVKKKSVKSTKRAKPAARRRTKSA
jgi:hypothetical protein